jgi:general secretion pathway protein G
VVIVILAIIAAIAIPRLSRGSEGAAEAAAIQNVSALQEAVDHYAAEHGIYPDPDQVARQLTLFTDAAGAVSDSKTPPYLFGPYVRKLPPLTTGPNKGGTAIATQSAAGVGWIYDPVTGVVTANLGTAAAKALPATLPSATPPLTPPVSQVQ